MKQHSEVVIVQQIAKRKSKKPTRKGQILKINFERFTRNCCGMMQRTKSETYCYLSLICDKNKRQRPLTFPIVMLNSAYSYSSIFPYQDFEMFNN